MLTLRNLSLQRKQTLVIVLTSGVVLLLACAAFIAYDIMTFRKELSERVVVLADAIGKNCAAAIDFHDPKAASDTLAGLRADENIISACVYSFDGEVFAVYQRDPGKSFMPPPPQPAGEEFRRNQLHVFRSIEQEGANTGMIYVTADLNALSRRLWNYVRIACVVFVMALLVAMLLSSRVQRLVSQPILQLAQVARKVAQDRDYSVRADKHGDDEIGQLVDGFNEMLYQIQQRDEALQSARANLEKRVTERTAQLAESVSQLNATLDSTADGILVVNSSRKKILQNQQMVNLWKLPPELANSADDTAEIQHILKMTINPKAFLARVKYFYSHPDLGGRDEVELIDGTIIEQITAPVLDKDGKNYGRIWTFRNVTENKKYEMALRESQALYHSLVEQLPAGVFRKDATGRYVFANSSFCRIVETPAEQVIGKTVLEMIAQANAVRGDDRSFSDQFAKKGITHHEMIMQTGREIELEEEHVGKDGKVRHYAAFKSPVIDLDGQIIGTQGVLFDITERKRAERKVLELQALYHSLVDQMPAGIFRKNAEGRYVFVNSWFCELKGMKPEQIVGKMPSELAAYELGNQSADQSVANSGAARETRLATQGTSHHEMIMSTGKRIEVAEEYPGAEGKTLHLHVVKSPVFGSDGKITGTQGMLFDITERKEAEAELSYERDLLRALLDNSPDHIYFKDQKSRFITVSRSKIEHAFNILRHRWTVANNSSDDICQSAPHLASMENFSRYLTGKSDSEIYDNDCAGNFDDDEPEIIRTGKPVIGKVEKIAQPDGSAYWFLTTKLPWYDKNGNIIGTVGTSKDITELKTAEAKIEETTKRLIETSRRAGMAEIASNVLHNVGNVLNSVNVSASVVSDKLKKSKVSGLARVVTLLDERKADLGPFFTIDPKGKQMLEYLDRLSKNLLTDHESVIKELSLLRGNVEHIKEIVTMQQSYARVAGVKEILDIRELVEDGLRLNEGSLKRHRVEVIREFDHIGRMNVEKHKILQILVNLIRNAKFACEESERLDKSMTVRIKRAEKSVQIVVSDNGVGIPQGNLTRIFSHGFTTRKDGHGFGLHSGALAANEMGGSLTVHSDGPGKGATFTLELPSEPI